MGGTAGEKKVKHMDGERDEGEILYAQKKVEDIDWGIRS